MKRAARIGFHLAAGVSGALFLVAVGFWIASYGSTYAVSRAEKGAHRTLAVARGEVTYYFSTPTGSWAAFDVPRVRWRWTKAPAEDLLQIAVASFPDGRSPIAGFWFHRAARPSEALVLVFVPLPFVVLLFALLPLADLFVIRPHQRRRRRAAAGLCVRCGYDLRATPEKCPECGAFSVGVRSV